MTDSESTIPVPVAFGPVVRLAVAFLLTTLAATTSSAADEPAGPLEQKGKLDQLRDTTSKLVKLGWHDGRLAMLRSDDADELREAFNAIESIAGGGSSVSWWGDSRRSWTFVGDAMHGELVLEKTSRLLPLLKSKGWPNMKLTLREKTGPQRTLTIHDNGKGGIVISLTSDKDHYFLRMRQRPGGAMLVQELNGDFAFAAQGNTFLNLYKSHRKYVEDRLMPILRHVGVTPPPIATDPKVQVTVLSLLMPIDDKLQEEFEQILKQLEASNFQDREKATSNLREGFKRFKPLLLRAASDERLAPESHNRIDRVLKSANDADGQSVDYLVATLALDRDVKYLIWLLEVESAKKPTDAKHLESLSGRLKQLTEQELGVDVAAWKAWREKQTKKIDSKDE